MRLLLLCALASFSLQAAEITLRGRVVDENDAPVRGARVIVRPAAGLPATEKAREAITDPTGQFTLVVAQAGEYLVDVDREGYYALKDRPVSIQTDQEIALAINPVREVFQSVEVGEKPSPIDIAQTGNSERLTGTELNDIPYANTHSLRNAMILLPGVVEDTAGGLHVNGSSENQILYLLNGFNLTDPISGQFNSLLAVEGIREVELSTGRYSPALGRGSAGALAISTENGTDAFHYTATNFLPGLSIQQGLHLGNWYPRFGVSGPILRGRAWFSDTFDSEYTEAVIRGLPSGQNTRSAWAGSNLLHTQFNLNASNILFADFLINQDHEGRVGLGPLNPFSTTSHLDRHEYFASIKDQVYLGRGMLVEFGYAHNHFLNIQTPQGNGLYILSPAGNSGNYFVNARQTSSRDEGLIHLYLPQIRRFGTHQIEIGGDADLRSYTGIFNRTGYEVLDVTGALLSETLFPAGANFRVRDTEQSSYLLDNWRVAKRFQLTLGVREDWDQRTQGVFWSPRLAFSWAPFSSARTRITGGYAITHDALTMDILGRPLDQTAVTTTFNAFGEQEGSPAATSFTIGNTPIVLPRAINWTLGVDHQISKNIYASAKFLRRRATEGFAFVNLLNPTAPPSLLPLPGGEAGGIYQLTNQRRDDYDSYQVSVRQTFSGQHEWMVAYTRSRAISDAVLDPNTAQPLQILPGFVPMPWDAPNRVLGFAYLPIPWRNLGKKWAISALADMRTGYPFSVRDPSGVVIGAVDSYRYPLNFDLNIAIERLVTLRGYRFALRLGADNITNQANATSVNNVTGAPQFREFLGEEGRHFVARIRFFGRAIK